MEDVAGRGQRVAGRKKADGMPSAFPIPNPLPTTLYPEPFTLYHLELLSRRQPSLEPLAQDAERLTHLHLDGLDRDA